MNPELVLRAAGHTDVGRRRHTNEDTVLVSNELGLYLVADGAGGHRSGEVASALASALDEELLRRHDQQDARPAGVRSLRHPIGRAAPVGSHSEGQPRRAWKSPRLSRNTSGMGTTVVAACFSPRSGLMHVAHVGDSRCYRLRGGHLELLTQDHSLLTDVLEQRPELDDTVLARLPKNIVTRALGIDPTAARLAALRTRSSRAIATCSARDGLSVPVPAQDLAETLGRRRSSTPSRGSLIELANDAGGPDNIAALVIECTDGPDKDSVPPPPPAITAMDASAESRADPELLILGIEDLEALDADSASDDLLRALEGAASAAQS